MFEIRRHAALFDLEWWYHENGKLVWTEENPAEITASVVKRERKA